MMRLRGMFAACAAALAAAGMLRAQEADFQAREYVDAAGEKLLYRLLVVGEASPEKPRPLLLFLHGAGERGADNQAQLKWGRELMVRAAKEYGAVVLVPQCPAGKRWIEVDWSAPEQRLPAELSQPVRLLLELIPQLKKQYHLDPDRYYVMGLSMGGYGSWGLIQAYPKMFAAAVPICGGGDSTAAAAIKDVPVWAFHGAADPVVPVGRSRAMIEKIKAAGGQPRYTEYEGVGHNSWSPAFEEPELLPWLFAQRRK